MWLLAIGCDDASFGGSHEVTGSGFEAVVEVFNAECTACHNPATAASFGDLDLETDPCGALVGEPATNPSYGASLLVAVGDHEASVLWDKVAENGAYGGVMPTAGKMGSSNIDIIADWIDSGAECTEEGGGDPGDTGDTGGPETSEYSLARVESEVLDIYCQSCHGGDEPSGDLDLSDATTIASKESSVGVPMVVAGDPEASYIYMKMRGTHDPEWTGDRGDAMPPPGQGAPAEEEGGLEDTEALLLVYGWILEGAEQ
jgi:hypothetical protein